MAIRELSRRHSAAGNSAGALEAAKEAVSLWEQLTVRSSTQFASDLASSYETLASRQAAAGEGSAELASREHAIELYRAQLASGGPAVRRRLAYGLVRLTDVAALDKYRGVAFVSEAVTLFRGLTRDGSSRATDLAWALDCQARMFERVGMTTNSIAALQEAVKINEREQLGEQRLAKQLVRLVEMLRRAGRLSEAKLAIEASPVRAGNYLQSIDFALEADARLQCLLRRVLISVKSKLRGVQISIILTLRGMQGSLARSS
jgi:hypothetical protein